MKPFITFLVLAAFTLSGAAQVAPSGAGVPPASVKPKPYSADDTRVYVTIAEGVRFQLVMSQRLVGSYQGSDPGMPAFASNLLQASTELWRSGVDAAMQHGVQGKKIPQDMSKNDQAALAKLGTIKDQKKGQIAFFELYAKESKKNAADTEKGAKAAQDPDLKAYAEKAAGLLKTQAEAIEAKFKELKTKK